MSDCEMAERFSRSPPGNPEPENRKMLFHVNFPALRFFQVSFLADKQEPQK